MKINANCGATSAAGSWNEPMPGSVNSAACWCVMSICSPPTVPSSTWLASGSRSGGIFETRSSHTTGFYAWKSSEDQNDVIAGCVYNAPSAFPRVDVTVKVVSGASGSGLKQKLGPGDHCQAIVIKRH